VFGSGVWFWCLVLVFGSGVWFWCLVLVFGFGVWFWCLVFMFGSGVWFWCLVLVFGSGVWFWCLVLAKTLQFIYFCIKLNKNILVSAESFNHVKSLHNILYFMSIYTEKIKEEYDDLLYKKEYLETIPIYFLYVDINSNLESIESIKHSFTDNTVLKKEQLMYYIETYKKRENKKYKIIDFFLYSNDLEKEKMDDFFEFEIDSSSFKELAKPFLRKFSFFNDIIIPENYIMFHSFSGIYLIFQEQLKPDKNGSSSISKKYIKSLKNHQLILDGALNSKQTRKKRKIQIIP